MVEVLLHLRLCLLGKLRQLAFTLLADHFECGVHAHMRTNRATNVRLIKLRALLFFQLAAGCLRETIGDLAIDLRQLLNRGVGGIPSRRDFVPSVCCDARRGDGRLRCRL